MDLTNPLHAKLLSAFDDWSKYHEIKSTFERVNYPWVLDYDTYVAEVLLARHARTTHPELPLHEAYIKYTLSKPSKGMGDTIYKLAHTKIAGLSLAQIAHSYTNSTGKDCGCTKRRSDLNDVVPYEGADGN